MTPVLLTAAFSYLLGSIPFGYILVRLFRGEDIRRSGSGNIGATNVARSSPALGALTLLLDASKGLLAAFVAMLVAARTKQGYDENRLYLIISIAALFAILGHSFPIWLNFRGGKGVATAVGAFSLLAPYAMLASVGVFLAVAFASRYVSLSSVTAAAVFPLLAWFLYRAYFSGLEILVMCMTSILIIARHHENIGRLLSGTEPRFSLKHS
jgi:acyl phosphate:glycerol-3-phosphate acyltransferase